MPVCKLYLLLISADAAQERKKEKKVLLPNGISKSAAHRVLGTKQGNIYTGEWDLPLVQSSIHKKICLLSNEVIFIFISKKQNWPTVG
jgi:hypothetical protein